MSQIQGMKPEPPHRTGDKTVNPAASLLPTDGGSVGDGVLSDKAVRNRSTAPNSNAETPKSGD